MPRSGEHFSQPCWSNHCGSLFRCVFQMSNCFVRFFENNFLDEPPECIVTCRGVEASLWPFQCCHTKNPRLIQRLGNTWLRYLRTAVGSWTGTSSCWNSLLFFIPQHSKTRIWTQGFVGGSSGMLRIHHCQRLLYRVKRVKQWVQAVIL